jgi:hypothetical protein
METFATTSLLLISCPKVATFFEKGHKSLVADQDMRQGETIIELPKIFSFSADRYSIEVYPGIHVVCTDSPVGSINHSCEPNAAVRTDKIIAWNCIKKGEEITIDYKRTETKLSKPFDCKCGSKHCRGRIE